jgi:hypothetical protein
MTLLLCWKTIKEAGCRQSAVVFAYLEGPVMLKGTKAFAATTVVLLLYATAKSFPQPQQILSVTEPLNSALLVVQQQVLHRPEPQPHFLFPRLPHWLQPLLLQDCPLGPQMLFPQPQLPLSQ